MTMSILIIQIFTVQYKGIQALLLPLKAVTQFTLFAFANWVSVSRILDYHHVWWDVAAGSVLGWLTAVVVFYWFVKPVMEISEKAGSRSCKTEKKEYKELEIQIIDQMGKGSEEWDRITSDELKNWRSFPVLAKKARKESSETIGLDEIDGIATAWAGPRFHVSSQTSIPLIESQIDDFK